jgi:uncharacterized protein
MTRLINVHCHLLNYEFISASVFKSRSAALEWLLRHRGSAPLFRLAAACMPGRRFRRLDEAAALMKSDIHRVAASLRSEMKEAGIELAVPLMMDMGRTAFVLGPQVPFSFQAKLVSEIALEHFGALMPFVMVDPRRTRALDLLVRCLEQLGFYGVKMYPALGYHPDPDSLYNDPQTNDELRGIYEYCEKHMIPITTHCSPGGAYSDDILRSRQIRSEFTKPWSWTGVLRKYPRLYLNFAHFGQDLVEIRDSKTWAAGIRSLAYEYPHVYADLAYNKSALMPQTAVQFLQALNGIIDSDQVMRDRILFGTDWSMTRHTWREKDYVEPFLKLGEKKLEKIAFANALDFLFPQRVFPERIARFLNASGKNTADLPEWLRAQVQMEFQVSPVASATSDANRSLPGS